MKIKTHESKTIPFFFYQKQQKIDISIQKTAQKTRDLTPQIQSNLGVITGAPDG